MTRPAIITEMMNDDTILGLPTEAINYIFELERAIDNKLAECGLTLDKDGKPLTRDVAYAMLERYERDSAAPKVGDVERLRDLVERCRNGLKTAPVTDAGWCDQREIVLSEIEAALAPGGDKVQSNGEDGK